MIFTLPCLALPCLVLPFILLLRPYLCYWIFPHLKAICCRLDLLAENGKQLREVPQVGALLPHCWRMGTFVFPWSCIMLWCPSAFNLSCPLTLPEALRACHICDRLWTLPMTLSCWPAVHLDPWPAMHLEVLAWPLVMACEIGKWLEGAGGICGQVGKLITWVEAPCSQHLGAFCFLPDHLVASSRGWWPNHRYQPPTSCPPHLHALLPLYPFIQQ